MQSRQSEATAVHVPDLRFGFVPTIDSAPGIDPAGDAQGLLAPGASSPATKAIPGTNILFHDDTGRRYVLRVPDQWNGSLVVAGTPGTRSEFATDAIWSDFVLLRGYAFASSNKGIPYNAVMEPIADAAVPGPAYPIPFDADGLESKSLAMRFGVLTPKPIGIASWNDDFRRLIGFAQLTLRSEFKTVPKRTYLVGVSNGGAQVRTALETLPDIVDGGLEYAAPYWKPEQNLLDMLPPFLTAMPSYIESGFRDPQSRRVIESAGFPPDVVTADPSHPSLWCEYYSNAAPYYNDLTLFVYALLIDPNASAAAVVQAPQPNSTDPRRLPGRVGGSGLVQPSARAEYLPSPQARDAIVAFTHTGALQRPLISLAGTKDMLIPPTFHADGYAQAVATSGSTALHRLYLIDGATHFDKLANSGYWLQPALPFMWAAFDKLVRTVEAGDTQDAGVRRVVTSPSDIG